MGKINIRKAFENYYENQARIVLLESMIDTRKIDLMPDMVTHLSHTPKSKGNSSNVESTVIKWDEDDTINNLLKEKAKTERLVQMVEDVINTAPPMVKDILNLRYFEGETVERTAEKLYISESTIKRKVNAFFKSMQTIIDKT